MDDVRLLGPTAVMRAVRFPTTVVALRRLGFPAMWRRMWGYVVEATPTKVRLVSGGGKVLAEFDAERIITVEVHEAIDRSPYPAPASPAVVLTVRSERGDIKLPIVPVSDDGKRSLRWRDAEVHALAARLTEALGRR